MSVWIWAFANHSIEFKKFENRQALIDAIIPKLNSLHLSEDNRFCKLFRCEKGERWKFEEYEESKDWPLTLTFTLGQYDLEVSENFIFRPSVFPYTHWFAPRNDCEEEEIVLRHNVIQRIVKVLGGNIIEYFPDNMLEQSSLMPSEQEDYKNLTMVKHLDIVKKQWSNICYSYEEAARCWPIADEAPLLIELL